MAVPLFDTSTPLDPLRAEIADAIARVVDGGRFILGPEVAAFEQEFAATCGAAACDRRRERHRRADDRPARDRRRPRRRGRRARRSPSTRPPRRSRRPARARSSATSTPRRLRHRARPSRAALTPRHEGRDRGPPVRQHRARRRDRGARACRCSRTPRRRPARATDGRPAGRARRRPRRSASSRRRTSAASATAARSRRTTPRSPTACRMLRFHGSYDKTTFEHVGYNSRLDELQAAILRVLLPHLDTWADGRRAAAGPLRAQRPRGPRHAPAADGGRGAGLAPVRRSATPRSSASPRRWPRVASATRRTTACPPIVSRR